MGLFCYPGILFICWVWVSINRVLNAEGKKNVAILDYFDYTFIGLSGLLNASFYAYNSIMSRTSIVEDLKTTFNLPLQDSQLLEDSDTEEI
jgi:hypothetical protein